jgi:SAM-dependent methyltransferase
VTQSSDTYDALWRSAWGDMQRLGPVHRHVQGDLVRLVGSLDVRTILDVGCGAGDNLARLASLGRYELTGTDVSDEALELARARAGGVRLLALDVERGALDERFDLVMSIQVVEHLADDLAALRHMASMAEKYVFTSTISGRMRRSEVAIGHMRNYSQIELRRKLELAGLEVLWVRGWGFPFYSPLYRTAAEWLPGGPPTGSVGPIGRVAANALYQLYRLNVPGRGDVVSALARPRRL